jgi:hypothetical protein
MNNNGRVLNKVQRTGISIPYSLVPSPYSLLFGTPHPPTIFFLSPKTLQINSAIHDSCFRSLFSDIFSKSC